MGSNIAKKIAVDLLVNMENRRWGEVRKVVPENAVWWVAGDTSYSGVKSREELIKMVGGALDLSTEPFRFDIRKVYADGDTVIMEVESSGEFSGRPYRQKYVMVMTFNGEEIVSVKEYLDTKHLHDVFQGL